jgi:hypothetical protein
MRLLQAAVLTGFSTLAMAAGPVIPDAIKAPAGEKLVLKTHATGAQIYSCGPGEDGSYKWTLKAPDADLHNAKGAVVGHHFAGPSWKYKDGSEIKGKASAHVDSPDADSIPWLLVSVIDHSGSSGLFTKVTSIQRINTKGGKPAASSPCDQSKNGTELRSDYSADYWFYAPGK